MNKNSIIVGIIVGTVIPFVGFAILLEIWDQLEAADVVSVEGLSPNFRRRTLALVALSLNLLPFFYYNRKYFTQSMRGVVFPTVLYGIAWFVYYGAGLIE